MTIEQILTIVMSLLGGGSLVALIQVVANRKKNKSEVTDLNVKTAIELEKMAMTRYNDATASLDNAFRLLNEAREELTQAKRELTEAKRELHEAKIGFDVFRNHCVVLEGILTKNNIPLPPRPAYH